MTLQDQEERQGLAIRLEPVKTALSYSLDMLERAIIEGGFGRKGVVSVAPIHLDR